MSDFIASIDTEISALKIRFTDEQAVEGRLAEQKAELDRKLGVSRTEQIRMQGELRALEQLKQKEQDKAGKPDEKIN